MPRMIKINSLTLALLGLCVLNGCVVYDERPRRVVYVEERGPYVQETVIDGPGVHIVEIEPAPVDRVYVYEVGYPPGCYFYGGFFWYGGRYYDRTVFIDRVVNVNVRENRYVNVEENRRVGAQIEAQHRESFARNGGRRNAAPHNGSHPEHAANNRQEHSERSARAERGASGGERKRG